MKENFAYFTVLRYRRPVACGIAKVFGKNPEAAERHFRTNIKIIRGQLPPEYRDGFLKLSGIHESLEEITPEASLPYLGGIEVTPYIEPLPRGWV
jgi:hypothetical protein